MKQLITSIVILISLTIKGQSLQVAQGYLDRSDYRHAVPLYENIAKEAKQDKNIDIEVTAQNGLADCYMDLGANYKAMGILKQNIIILNRLTMKNYLLLAKTHQLLAICYDKLYLIEDYLTECNKFYGYYKKAAPGKEIYKALYYAYIGRYYNMRYIIDKAFYYTDAALKIYHKHKNEHLIDDYVFYNAHLFTIRNRKDSSEIKLKYLDSLQYFINRRYPYDNIKKSRLFVSIAAINLDLAYAFLNNTDEVNYEKGNFNANKAIDFYTKGIVMNDKFAGYYYTPSAYLYSLKGLMYFYKKDYLKTIANYDEGIKRLINPNDSGEINFNGNKILIDLLNWKSWCLEKLYAQKKDTKLLFEIEKNLLLCEKIWRQYNSLIIKSKKQYDTNFYSNSPYNSLVKNYYQLILETGKRRYVDLYFEYAEKSKYNALLESLYKEKATINPFKDNYSIDNYCASLDNLFLKINNKISTLNSKEEYLKEVKKQFRIYNSDNPNLFQKKIISLKDIQKKLNENEAILSYSVTGIQTNFSPFVIMITKRKVKVIRFKDDYGYFDQKPQVVNLIENLEKNLITDYKKVAFDYYKDYFKPIECYLPKSIKHIQVIPTSNFANFPFDLLLTEPSKSNDFSQLPYLAKKYQFSYALSSTISNLVDKSTPKSNQVSIFNPHFYSKDLSELKKTNNASQVLSETYNTKLIKEKKATKSLFSKHLETDKVLILLSHGKATTDENESQKGVYLSNGFLSLNDVYNLKTNCDFLLLGACETGIGYRTSREGTINLARAFTAIGVKSMMLSSWKIDESSSAQIITSFLKYMDSGYSKSEALQKAKLDYLSIASPRMSNPLYWAGLNITGNNETIQLQERKYYWLIFGLIPIIGGGLYFRKRRIKN